METETASETSLPCEEKTTEVPSPAEKSSKTVPKPEPISDTITFARREFDCGICFSLLYEPITIECGHTYCRDCLSRAFKRQKHCPLCRRHSTFDPFTHPHNILISKLLEKYDQKMYRQRSEELKRERSERKQRFPIFSSRTPEFPFCKIGLHIYESKYRIMVDRVLRLERVHVTPHLFLRI